MLEHKYLILIVDDNPVNIQIVGEHLRNAGHDISIATSGMKALSIISQRKPDLILLDIMMPDMDGYEVCKQLKSNPETLDIPIIFLTAKVDELDIVKGFSLGAVDYVVKPIKSEELKARIDTQLNLKYLHDQLNKQKEDLERLNKDKNEFLGVAAHDLKNPIYSISMIAKLLRDDKTISLDDVREFSQDIITSTDRMLDLISQLLDINSIEEGKVKFTIENNNVDEIIKEILSHYRERASAKKITLHYTCSSSNVFANFDLVALRQTLDNLVSNAIKFSPFGKNIYVELKESDGSKIIIVKDEGPGLTEEDKAKLFGKFVKLSARPTGDEDSTGLGLSIVKKYVEGMNGRIYCESQYGYGASFIVELPVA